MAVTGAFFSGFNAGNAETVLGLLTADATVTEAFGHGGQPDDIDIAFELAWFTGQGTVLTAPDCTLDTLQPAEGTSMVCLYSVLDALTQALDDAPPVPTSTLFTVTSLGRISSVHLNYAPEPGDPDFEYVGRPFRGWLATHRPDVECLSWYADNGNCPDSSRDDAEELARIAQEFAAWLGECDYRFWVLCNQS